MAAKAFGFTVPHFFPSLGPALMISMGYIDLGKWVAAVEGGAQFRFNLGLLVFLFNLTAILCQYLAACIAMVSGKNLAEICSEEYCKLACILLGLQAELSMIISDLTTIVGMAHGLNLLFGVDLFTCIFFVTAGSVLLPLFFMLLNNQKAEALYIGMASFALLFYVLGVLISQPEIPLVMNEIFPKLSGENVYSLMALLGANIMAHNFYIHSSIVQQQRRSPNAATGALSHDHFFAILFIFTGIFLVNYVLMNSAAAVFGSADVAVLNFQDISLLMDQLFKSPIAPIAVFLVLFLSSQITTLTWNVGGQVILRYFFGMNLSVWVHHAFSKSLSIILALYCAKSADAEGIYQLLISSQVILAILLPSSVIPLFRVASSRFIMGTFKISWHLEILALFAFLGMLAANTIFTIEMLFGNSSWIMNLRGGMGSSVVVPFAILFISCTSLGLTLYLAVTPMKSASIGPDTQTWTWNSRKGHSELFEGRGDDDLDIIKYDEDRQSAAEPALDKSTETKSDSSILEFNLDMADTVTGCDHHSHQSAHAPNLDLSYQLEESKSVVEADLLENMDMVSADVLSDRGVSQIVEMKDLDEKDVGVEAFVPTDKNNEGGDALELGESPREALKGPGYSNNIKDKGPDGGNGSGSLSRLSGLGRAARRQFAAILDEFWGNLFDFHGKLTQEASAKRLDILLGLDLKTVGSSVKAETTGAESSKNFYPDADRGPILPVKWDYYSTRQQKIQNMELPLGVQMGSPSWSETMPSNLHLQSSCRDLLDPGERSYSSLRLPQHNDNNYQPATIHGYQMASYLKEIRAASTPYSSSMSRNTPPTPKSAASFLPNLRDQVMYARGQNELGNSGTSSLQSPATSRISRLQFERPYYEPSLLESGDSGAPSASTKKYHSSPDISSLIASSRNLFLNDGKPVGLIGPRQSLGRMAYEQSQYMNTVSRAGVPLTFDELSPPKLHRDVSSPQSSMNMDTKSLWSRQPFEQLFGRMGKDQSEGDRGVTHRPRMAPNRTFSYADSEAKLLQSLRFCITKLLQLEGSDWLFKQNGGFDEDLIDRVAAAERYLHEKEASETNQMYMGELQQLSSERKFGSAQSGVAPDVLPNCGDGCIWGAALAVSFGVWCIRRILELALVESRPELWGKYTYVLNRLQGIIEPAFSKPRQPPAPCACLRTPSQGMRSRNPSQFDGLLVSTEKASKNPVTTAGMVLEIIKDVEAAISGRKGRTGTAAGDVAFPKGKENLASVLKRYKRRLLNKFPATHEGTPSSRKISAPTTSTVL